MTEFQQGIFKLVATTSLGRAIVYTLGHVLISMCVVYFLTGASFFEAGLVAVIEPLINGCWYLILDRLFVKVIR
tara:strand:+ start:485 stop:706 length:222 start_codon:yes stop_codon:yes gene_type:complete